MIVPMQKVMVVSRASDRPRLLDGLRKLGVMHVAPVDARQAAPPPALAGELERVARAIQILEQLSPKTRASSQGGKTELPPAQVAHRVLAIQRESAELNSRLGNLRRQLDQLAMWGDVRLEQFEQLRAAGVEIVFAIVDADKVDQVQAELVQDIQRTSGGQMLVAAVRPGEQPWPADTTVVPLPARDRPSIRAEAGEIDAQLAAGSEELVSLVPALPALRVERLRVQQEVDYETALRSGIDNPDLFAIQGWVPADQAGALAGRLAERDVEAAVELRAPADNETPPTLVRYPKWAMPIKGLFDMLGLVPGYREVDTSIAFLIALPIFAAMLLADGGYALMFMLAPLLVWRKMVATFGRRFSELLVIIGWLGFVWGIMTSSFFGLDPRNLPGPAGRVFSSLHVLSVSLDDRDINILMWVSFIIGAIHLSLAQLWRALVLFPGIAFLSKVGWAIFLWGMFGVVRMFVLHGPPVTQTPMIWLLIVGGAMAIVFASPHRNPAVMIGLGLANFPLSAIGTFSDIMSYVRLMAIGLASTVLASTFNDMAASGPAMLAPLIVLFGHALNMGLFMIALFAHGVRLNVLEFSNNLGMEWSGYSYEPFAIRQPAQET